MKLTALIKQACNWKVKISIHNYMKRLFQKSKNTHAEFDRDVSYEEVEAVLAKLARSQGNSDEVACYVYGMGD